MQDENDVISMQDTKEVRKDDTIQKLMRQAKRHKVKESRVKAKEINLGEPDLDIEWHAAPFIKKCCCPAEPCLCQSHLLKAGYLPHSRLHFLNKDHFDKNASHTMVPRLAAAVKAEIEIAKQLKDKLEQRGPEFCASNCRAFLQPVKEGGYHAERKKLVEKYIKENNLENKMKHYIKIREGKCLQQIANRRKFEGTTVCNDKKEEKKNVSEESDTLDENEDEAVQEDLPEENPCKSVDFLEEKEEARQIAGAGSNVQVAKRRSSPCACNQPTAITDKQSSSTDDACAVPYTGTYTKLTTETNDRKQLSDTSTSPQSDDRILVHKEVECEDIRSSHMDKLTKDSETQPDKEDCACKKRDCCAGTDHGKRKQLSKLEKRGPIGRKYFSLI